MNPNDRQPNRQSDSSKDDTRRVTTRPDATGDAGGQRMPSGRQQPGSQGISNRPEDSDPDSAEDAEDTDESEDGRSVTAEQE